MERERGRRQGRCLSTSLASGKDQSQLLDMCWIRSLILRQQLSKYADEPFQSKARRCMILPALYPDPWGNIPRRERSCHLITAPSFAVVLQIQASLALGGVHPSVGSLKRCGTKYRIQTSCSSGRSWKLRVPSELCDAVLRVGLMARVSQPFLPILMWLLSHSPDM